MSNRFVGWLAREGAHHDVVQWAERLSLDWPEAWNRCPRGDWLMGFALRARVDRRALVRAAAACATLVASDVETDAARSALALAVSYGEGHAVDERAAISAATKAEEDARNETSPAGLAAALSAASACRAVVVDDAAGLAATYAVEAAVAGVSDCAVMAALAHMQSQCAAAVRNAISAPVIDL